MWDPVDIRDIRWNFEKILIGRDGRPVKRYNVLVEPQDIQKDITAAIKRSDHQIPSPAVG